MLPMTSTGLARGTRVRRGLILTGTSLLVGLTGAGCSGQQVPLPPVTASAQEVVSAYASAVHAGDCATAGALMADAQRSWCGSIDIPSFAITHTTEEERAGQGGGGHPIQRVWVELTSRGGDVSLPDGEHQWSYLLDRTGPHNAWRIYDQGMG